MKRAILLILLLAMPLWADTTIRNPYVTKANVYKGQLHTHTSGSDGADTPTVLVTAYRTAGYDFVCVTDHDVLTSDPAVGDILFIPGVEETLASSHLGNIGATLQQPSSVPQTVINAIAADGAISVLNHPLYAPANWTDAEILAVEGYTAIEIYNRVVQQNSEASWDMLLSLGHEAWGVAADDCHNIANAEFGVTWVMVHADSLTVGNVLASLKAGNFYSSTGPDLTVGVVGSTITATTSGSSTISFIGNTGAVLQTESAKTTSSYVVVGNEVYVRITLTRDSDGTCAWSNPFYLTTTDVHLEYYVDTDVVGGAGDGTSWANAYSSLNACEQARSQDLVTPGATMTWWLRASSGTADTTAVTINGNVEDATHYLTIRQADFPSDGVYDATKYRLYNDDDADAALTLSDQYTRLVNLQVLVDSTGTAIRRGIYTIGMESGGSDIRIDSCIVRAGTMTSTGYGIGMTLGNSDSTVYVSNCLAYGFLNGADDGFWGYAVSAGTATFYNCTAYNNYAGFRLGSGTATVTNCISGNNTDDFIGTMTIDYCASDDGDGGHAVAPLGGSWANEFNNAAGGDFSLKAGGNCIDAGTDNPGAGLYLDDIIGTIRVSPWDIGAFEYARYRGTTYKSGGKQNKSGGKQ